MRSGRPAGENARSQRPPLQSGNRRSGAPCLWRSPDPYASFGFPRRVIRHDDVPPNLAWLVEERTWLQDELQEARAEADQAKADQVRMARDVATMFDELRALADRAMPSCTPTGHDCRRTWTGWLPNWSRHGGRGGSGW